MPAPRVLASPLLPAVVLLVVVVALGWLVVGSDPPSPAPSPTASPTPVASPLASASTRASAPTSEPAGGDGGSADAGADPEAAPPATAPRSEPGDPSDATVDDPDAELITVRLSADELSDAATSGLPQGSPVDAIELAPRTAADGTPVLDARADVDGLPVELTGEVAVEVTGGELSPRLVDARVGPFQLPEGVRATIGDVLAGLADDLVDPGWTIEDVEVIDGDLVVRAGSG